VAPATSSSRTRSVIPLPSRLPAVSCCALWSVGRAQWHLNVGNRWQRG